MTKRTSAITIAALCVMVEELIAILKDCTLSAAQNDALEKVEKEYEGE